MISCRDERIDEHYRNTPLMSSVKRIQSVDSSNRNVWSSQVNRRGLVASTFSFRAARVHHLQR